MTVAAASLARLRELGVIAEARGDGLALRPASAVPPNLLADLRSHKADVLALLTAKKSKPLPAFASAKTAQPGDVKLAALHAACVDRTAGLTGAYEAPDVQLDREAIATEALLPAPGTAERIRHDQSVGALIAGLIRGHQAHRVPTPYPKSEREKSA